MSLRASLLLLFLLALGCRERREPVPESEPPPAGDPQRGALLVARFECNRCHSDAGGPPPALERDCVGCHRSRPAGQVRHFVAMPALSGVGRRLRRGWVERFLKRQLDVRPHLEESMPALDLRPSDARHIAAYLAPDEALVPYEASGDRERGRRLLDSKGCGTCHRMSGVAPLVASSIPVEVAPERLAAAQRLAPDLALSRERLLSHVVERWLTAPSKLAPNALMPDIPLSPREVRDIAAYVMTAPLVAPKATEPAPRLPLLERTVSYDEVAREVFLDTCWHCHSDSESRIGDGGPGNSGGFGFAGRGVNLSAHEHVLSGYRDDRGERRSLFTPDGAGRDGRLMRVLLLRRDEEAGRPDPTLRGMPLGLPALSPEKLQLVESWIAQGRSD